MIQASLPALRTDNETLGTASGLSYSDSMMFAQLHEWERVLRKRAEIKR